MLISSNPAKGKEKAISGGLSGWAHLSSSASSLPLLPILAASKISLPAGGSLLPCRALLQAAPLLLASAMYPWSAEYARNP